MGGKHKPVSIDKQDAFSGDIPKPTDNVPGTYSYTQSNTGLTYLGSTVNNYRRFICHTSALCRGTHGNRQFQRSFNADPNFEYRFDPIELMETVTATLLKVRQIEAERIDKFEDKTKLLNLSLDPFATGRLEEVSEETRRKISEKMKGRVVSAETRLRQSVAASKHRHSDESKEKMSINSSRVPVFVDGVEYRNAVVAAKALGLPSKGAINARCLSPNFPNYVKPGCVKTPRSMRGKKSSQGTAA